MPGEEISMIQAYKDVGIGIASLIIVTGFAKYWGDKAFIQVQEANKRLADTQDNFVKFIKEEYNRHSEVLNKLATSFDSHVKSKDEFMEAMKGQQQDFKDQNKVVNELFSMLKNQTK